MIRVHACLWGPPILSLALALASAIRCPGQTGLFAAGRRHLYLHCEGKPHGPTIILDAGLFRDSSDWHLVQPKVAGFTEVCSYDREGLGKSVVDGVLPEKDCIDQQEEDLHSLLQSAHIAAPYVLVGHSAGGVHVRRFERSYPSEVSGLVFVDSAHEEQIWRFQAIDPSSVQGPPTDPDNARCEGGLPKPGDRLAWHVDIPLVVLEHGIPLTFQGPMAAHTAEFNKAVDDMARDLASRSSQGQLRIAPHSGHDIMLDEPSVVVRAIHDVWEAASMRPANPK